MIWSRGDACESAVEAEVSATIRQLAPQCGYDVHKVTARLIEEQGYSVEELARLQRLIWARAFKAADERGRGERKKDLVHERGGQAALPPVT